MNYHALMIECIGWHALWSCSKKQKTQGGEADQSIDQLNDVTAVSGVNLRVSILFQITVMFSACHVKYFVLRGWRIYISFQKAYCVDPALLLSNLQEEEEQLLVGPKEESRTTEAMRKLVQEEEERLFLERRPLRAKAQAIGIESAWILVPGNYELGYMICSWCSFPLLDLLCAISDEG